LKSGENRRFPWPRAGEDLRALLRQQGAKRMRSSVSRLAGAGVFASLLLWASGVLAAPDPKAVADALAAAFSTGGKTQASYAGATVSGGDITITDFKVIQPDRKGREIDVPSVVVTGAADRPGGGFTAARIVFNDGKATYRQSTIAWQAATIEEVTIPPAAELAKLNDTFRPFARSSVVGISITRPELTQPIAVAKVDSVMAADAQGQFNGITVNASGIVIPASALDRPELQGMLQGLGYADLTATAQLDAAFDSAADTFTLNSMMLDVADVGKLAVTGKFSHVKVHPSGDQAGGSGTPPSRDAPMLDAMTVRLDNAGVIERALDMQAKLLGTTRDDVAGQWPMLLMFLIGDAGGMDFQEKLMGALTAFLKDPKSLTVTLAPTAPVPLDQLARTVFKDQAKVPELLGVDITANN
jgi:hypothetical protein